MKPTTRRGHRRLRRSVAAVAVLAMFAAACGGDDAGTAPVETADPPTGDDVESEPESTEPDTGEDDADDGAEGDELSPFEQLVEDARNSNHRVRMALDAYTPEQIEARERAFEERFGFPLILENEPGHSSLDIPVKVNQSAMSGRGVVDITEGNTSNFSSVFYEDNYQEPDWDVLASEWPIISDLREGTLELVNDAGEPLSQYCMLQSHLPWLPMIHTGRVSPEEIEGFTWESLADPIWQNRLAFGDSAGGFFVMPFAPGWDEERLAEFSRGVGANNPTIVSGGSAGQVQALLSGEADLAVAVSRVIAGQRETGAPLDWVIPTDFIPTSHRSICMPANLVNDPAMVLLYLGWSNTEASYLEAAAGGDPRLWPQEADQYPIAAEIAAAGLTADDLAFPRTPEEDEMIPYFQELANRLMTDG